MEGRLTLRCLPSGRRDLGFGLELELEELAAVREQWSFDAVVAVALVVRSELGVQMDGRVRFLTGLRRLLIVAF